MRADRAPKRRPVVRLSVLAAALWGAGLAGAQPKDPGADATRAYTPVTGLPQPLYPQAADAAPGRSAVFPVGDQAAAAAVARLVVEVERDAIPADGQTPVQVVVRLFDREGKPVTSAVLATIEHSGGRVLLPGAATDEAGPRGRDADRTVPGTQLRVEGGVARFALLAPYEAQDVRLRVTAGAESAEGVIAYVPEKRQLIAAGLVEGIVRLRRDARGASVVRRDGFEQEIQRWEREFNDGKANVAARTAFFVKGMVRGDVLLTAAYDSDKDTRQRLLRDVRPDEFYPVYGDSSLKGFDARSGDRLYVRVDRDKHYLLYGDFQTGDGLAPRIGLGTNTPLAQRSLGAYQRTATGVRAHAEDGTYVGNVFAFRDTLRQAVDEFRSQGSGPYALSNGAVYEGSEKVEIIVRDRTQPSRILNVTPLVRLVDYTFEPFSGRILLSTFLPSVDPDLNPVSLRVTYEVDQGGDAFWVAGADGQLRLNDQLEVGGSIVVDDNPLAAYRLGSANATWRFANGGALVAEVARSRTEVNTNPTNPSTLPGLANLTRDVIGNAWRLEYALRNETTDARAFAGRSDPTFHNPSAPLNGGRGELQARVKHKLGERLAVYAEAVRSEDRNDGGGVRRAGQVGGEVKLSDTLTLDIGLRSIREKAGTLGGTVTGVPFGSFNGLTGSLATGSAGGALGQNSLLLDPVSGLPVMQPGQVVPGSGSGDTTTEDGSSDSLRVGLGWRPTDRLTLGGEVEHEVRGDDRRRVALGGDYRLGERLRAYGRYERQTGIASPYAITTDDRRGDAFVFGLEGSVMRDTQLFNEYRLRDAASGRDLQLASGMRHQWEWQPGIRFSAGVENVRVISGNLPSTRALAFGMDHTAHELWKGSTRIEWRRAGDVEATAADDRFHTVLWQVMVARKLDRDWTLLARNHLLRTDYAARGDVLQDRAQVGIAYRDTDTNRVNALAKVEHKLERDDSDATRGTLESRAWILSTHADWHPSRPWWVTGRWAAKWQTDRFDGGVRDNFRAQLLAGRAVWDVTERWDVGVLGAVQFGQRGARQHAAGFEVGYLLQQNLWLSAGVNVTGFAGDRDLTGYEYTDRGLYLRLRFKFDENLWRRGDPSVNRTLDR